MIYSSSVLLGLDFDPFGTTNLFILYIFYIEYKIQIKIGDTNTDFSIEHLMT